MKYRRMGRTGLKVSELSLGTMTFGTYTDFHEAERMLNLSYDAGINFEVVKGVSPEFIASQLIDTFTIIDDEFSSTSVSAKPNKNSNDGLHTAAYYLTNFTGSIKIMATMSAGASYGTDDNKDEFFQVDRQDYTEQSGIKYVNFTGVFERVAFVAQMTDSSTVLAGLDKILYRS